MISEYMNIRNKAIEDPTCSINDAVFNLWRYSSWKWYTSYPLDHTFISPVSCLERHLASDGNANRHGITLEGQQTTHTFNVLFMLGTRRNTSPPPRGGAPRLSIFNSNPSRGTPNCLSICKVTIRKVSTEGSFVSLVIPKSRVTNLGLIVKLLREKKKSAWSPIMAINFVQKVEGSYKCQFQHVSNMVSIDKHVQTLLITNF